MNLNKNELNSLKQKLANHKKELIRKHQACGVGIGYKYVKGKRTSQIAIIFYVYRKRPIKELQKLGIEAVPKTLFDYPTDVQEVPEGFKIRSEKQRHRPFSGGVSGISIKEKGATGTLGLVSKKGEVLSNNHVLSNESLTVSRTAEKGDKFIQPGYADEGNPETDVVGELDRWVDLTPIGAGTCPVASACVKTLNFLAKLLRRKGRFHYLVEEDNYVDGAVGLAYEGLWQPGVMGLGIINNVKDEPELGEKVQKRGRTTSLTKGVVTAVGVSVNVGGYQGYYTCHFVDQIAIEGENGSMSAPGDSGSCILTLSEPYALVGLLFAGGVDSSGRDITIASPYKYVKQYLDFTP